MQRLDALWQMVHRQSNISAHNIETARSRAADTDAEVAALAAVVVDIAWIRMMYGSDSLANLPLVFDLVARCVLPGKVSGRLSLQSGSHNANDHVKRPACRKIPAEH